MQLCHQAYGLENIHLVKMRSEISPRSMCMLWFKLIVLISTERKNYKHLPSIIPWGETFSGWCTLDYSASILAQNTKTYANKPQNHDTKAKVAWIVVENIMKWQESPTFDKENEHFKHKINCSEENLEQECYFFKQETETIHNHNHWSWLIGVIALTCDLI